MSVDDIGLVDSIERTSLQLFHRLGNGDDFWDVHKRVNVDFNSADLYNLQFMPGAGRRDDRPNTLLDIQPDHGLPVLRAPNAMVSELGGRVVHQAAFERSLCDSGLIRLYCPWVETHG